MYLDTYNSEVNVYDVKLTDVGGMSRATTCTDSNYAEFDYPASLDIECKCVEKGPEDTQKQVWKFDGDFTLDDCTVAGGAGFGCGNGELQKYRSDNAAISGGC